MKKVVAILLAGVLTLGAAMTAFAAPSQTGSANNAGVTATSDKGTVIVSQEYTTTEDKAAAEALAAEPAATLVQIVGTEAAKDMSLTAVMDVRVEGYVSGPITITFKVPGVTTASTVYVLHYVNGAWQKEAATLGNGTVTVTFSSLSPVAIYVDKTTAAAANQGTTGTKSPQTGEAPVMAVSLAVAFCAIAGMAVVSRRRHA